METRGAIRSCSLGLARREQGETNMSELLDLALTAHGGHDRWRRIHSLEARLSLTGALYKAKGFPDGVPNVTMTVDAHRPAMKPPRARAPPMAGRMSRAWSPVIAKPKSCMASSV